MLQAEFDPAERRQLTVMFCDLVESTRLAESMDPEDLLDLIRRFQSVARQGVEAYDGHVAQYLGDGVLIYFGYPRAHEDDARRAVMSGLEIAESMSRLSEELEREQGVTLACRIGLHTGPVVAGDVGVGEQTAQLALGSTPNVAARVQGEAATGQVLLTEDSHLLVERFFECERLGPRSLRGLPDPVVLYRALRPRREEIGSAAAVRGQLTPYVGRDRELDTLLYMFEQTRIGRGQVVLLRGGPGFGKSRLQHELRLRVKKEIELWVDCHCSAYQLNSALHPIIDYMERALGFQPGDDAAGKLIKLEAQLEDAGISVADGAPLLARMLSLPTDAYELEPSNPDRDRKKTLELLVGLVRHWSTRGPVVVAVEDLHWADPTTVEFLELLVERIVDARVLVIVATRPEPEVTWKPRTTNTLIELQRLNDDEAASIVDAAGELSPALRREVVARTDGVPLFVEELTRTIRASGLGSNAQGDLAQDFDKLIPNTLRDSLMAQLDALGPAKDVAQLAAVLGRRFRYEILEAVSTLEPGSLREFVARIVDSGLFRAVGSTQDASYEFKHALVQDTAYDSLLRSRRSKLHDRVADVLLKQFPAEVEKKPETLARHCEAAGRKAEAVEFYSAVGARAAERSANVEATAAYRRALGLLADLEESAERDRHEGALVARLAATITAHMGHTSPELLTLHMRTRELFVAHGQGDDPMSLVTFWGFHAARGDRAETLEWAEEILQASKRVPGPIQEAIASLIEGWTAFYIGDQPQAIGSLDRGLKLLGDELPPSLDGLGGMTFIVRLIKSWSLLLAGFPEQAWSNITALLAHAEKINDPFGVAQALAYMCGIGQDLGREPEEIRANAERLVEVAAEYELGSYMPFGHTFRGWSRAMLGDDGGLDEMRDAIDASSARGDRNSTAHSLALLACALQERGRTDAALAAVDASLEAGSVNLEANFEAEGHRIKGELLWKQGDLEAAEACLRRALEVARGHGARLLELRAATTLTELMQEKGPAADAARRLREVYDGFTEGFDSRHLRDARAILDRVEKS